MLIIFDLDDTLIDTSRVTTPFLMERALDRMVAGGLVIDNRSVALQALLEKSRTAKSSKEALELFLEGAARGVFLPEGLKALYEELPKEAPIVPVPGALEVLEALSTKHKLALVSFGGEVRQRYKMEKAGIDTALFSKLYFLSEPLKGDAYKEIVSSFPLKGKEQLLVCGDRVSVDLEPAKKLGATTIQMRRGRGLLEMGGDFQVSDFWEFAKMIQKIEEYD